MRAGHVDALRSDGAAQRDAVETGDHDVEHDQIELVGAGALERGRAFGDLFDVEAGE